MKAHSAYLHAGETDATRTVDLEHVFGLAAGAPTSISTLTPTIRYVQINPRKRYLVAAAMVLTMAIVVIFVAPRTVPSTRQRYASLLGAALRQQLGRRRFVKPVRPRTRGADNRKEAPRPPGQGPFPHAQGRPPTAGS